MYDLKVKLTFIESVLGLTPGDPEIYRSYIASKAPDAATTEDEVASLGIDKVVENGMTVFPREQGEPFFYDYQVKGFFKDTCGMLRRVPAYASSSLKNYKKVIDGLVFVFPRKIPVHYEGDIGLCERPLRASTPQGERVALAISEEIPAGATMEFTITCMDEKDLKLVREWLDYGYYRGLGQWRNSGKGRFLWAEVS